MFDVWKVDHIDSKGARPNTGRFDVVVGFLTHVKQHGFKATQAGWLTISAILRQQRHFLIRRVRATAHKEIHITGLEAKELCRDTKV